MATRIATKKADGVVEIDARIHVEEPSIEGKGLRVAVVVATFNADITEKLLHGALGTMVENGVDPENIKVYRVPGAWELPLAAERIAAGNAGRKHPFHAILALGAVIRGDTPHFDYVCNETSRGLMNVGMMTGLPVTFGVLTTDNLEQAQARAGGELGNKGSETAEAALQMANLYKHLA